MGGFRATYRQGLACPGPLLSPAKAERSCWLSARHPFVPPGVTRTLPCISHKLSQLMGVGAAAAAPVSPRPSHRPSCFKHPVCLRTQGREMEPGTRRFMGPLQLQRELHPPEPPFPLHGWHARVAGPVCTAQLKPAAGALGNRAGSSRVLGARVLGQTRTHSRLPHSPYAPETPPYRESRVGYLPPRRSLACPPSRCL